ncbi:MAG TPA: hypothetical protein VIL23_04905 [Clostridia bacterium]
MDFCKLNECELNFAISALANALADGLDNEELLFLSRILSQLSNTLQLIFSHRALCSKKDDSKQFYGSSQTGTDKK